MLFLFPSGASSSSPKRLRKRLCIAGIMVPVSFGVLQAQEVPDSARQIILDVGQRFEWSDNPDLEEEGEDRFTSRTTLQLRAFQRTRTDEFSFSLGGDLELSDSSNSDDDGLANTNLGLGWARNVGHARTGVALDYSEVDLGNTTGTFFNDDTGSIDFGTVERGTRKTTDLILNGAFGIDNPIGGSYAFGQREIRYSDTQDDTDLRDADRLSFTGDVFFVVDPRLTLGFDGSYTDFDEVGPDDLDTTATRVGTFAEIGISPTLTGRFGLGWEEVEETGTTNNIEDGVTFDAALTKELPGSILTFDVISDIVATGRRGEFRVGQSFELPRNSLSYSLGISRIEDFDTEPLIGLGWSQDLPRGEIRFILEQSAETSRDNENLINSRMAFGYTQELTARSGFDVEFSFIDRNDRSSSDLDTKRYDLGLTYRHALSQDWNVVGGVTVVSIEEDEAPDSDANTIFIGLEKRFVWN